MNGLLRIALWFLLVALFTLTCVRCQNEVDPKPQPIHVYYCDTDGCRDGGVR